MELRPSACEGRAFITSPPLAVPVRTQRVHRRISLHGHNCQCLYSLPLARHCCCCCCQNQSSLYGCWEVMASRPGRRQRTPTTAEGMARRYGCRQLLAVMRGAVVTGRDSRQSLGISAEVDTCPRGPDGQTRRSAGDSGRVAGIATTFRGESAT